MSQEESSQAAGAVSVIPTLFVDDLPEAEVFYSRLGFHRDWSYPEDGTPSHLGFCFGDVTVMLALNPQPGRRVERQNLYFVVKRVDELHQRLARELGGVVTEIEDADYGMRDFSITDPWGHLLTFGAAA